MTLDHVRADLWLGNLKYFSPSPHHLSTQVSFFIVCTLFNGEFLVFPLY